MDQYQDHVARIMEYLTERKQCASSRASHQKCYEEFGAFLEENGLMFTAAAREEWLASIRSTYSRQQCYFWRNYLQQLQTFMETGAIPDVLFYQIRPSYESVPAAWKTCLDEYIETVRADYTQRSLALAKGYCARIILFFSGEGLHCVKDITFHTLDRLYHNDFGCQKEIWYVYMSHARAMLSHWARNNLCPHEFSIFLDERIYLQVGCLESFSASNLSRQEPLRDAAPVPLDEFRKKTVLFQDALKARGYQKTELHTAARLLKALYLFLYRYDFGYHPEVTWIWFAEIRITLGTSWKSWRRTLECFNQYMVNGDWCSGTRYTFQKDPLDALPEWCRTPIAGFMDRLLREFRSPGTAKSCKYGCIRFARFLLDHNIHTFADIKLEHLRLFSVSDRHETADGRATYLSIVRRFLCYLEEQGLASAGIHYGILTECANPESVADILTDEQVRRIYDYRAQTGTPLEMRNAAMVMAGLELGLRASDVVNLKLSDINWKSRQISILQAKTKTAITLPFSNILGNSLYRYIRHGRPQTSCPNVFVRHRAPYGALTTKICNKALYTILPERKEIHQKGFHVTRRTFATRLLRHDAGIDTVVDSLGHSDNTSAAKYLAFDEERMRMCPLSLALCPLTLVGGAE